MCTVTYIPQTDGFILTSNRDEKTHRPTLAPEIYIINNTRVVYPKDKQAGGTWIAGNEKGTCIVLLNGAFENHEKKENYRKSRGTILLEILDAEDVLNYFIEIDLTHIEPFTLIVAQHNKLTELKWDSRHKYRINYDVSQPFIWSSATLYNREQQDLRKQWFKDFIQKQNKIDDVNILKFHNNTQPSNNEYGLIINRNDVLTTVSISQLILKNNTIKMTYIDRINNTPIKEISL
ncbi:NRDE family protein [uncultured Formosa sp.]|uniref:NRDE family protein n=1 Tax=uncultured Formosa sp. TaxID=255435 RepID=UPI00260208C5|nr:NRDE family protein [uncultured Formosa sp.]